MIFLKTSVNLGNITILNLCALIQIASSHSDTLDSMMGKSGTQSEQFSERPVSSAWCFGASCLPSHIMIMGDEWAVEWSVK